jgi:dolichyl-phosphate beta-glucosyltransferase
VAGAPDRVGSGDGRAAGGRVAFSCGDAVPVERSGVELVGAMHKIALVIPCFNEAQRLPVSEFLRFAEARPDLVLVFVNDGSTDDTSEVLGSLRHRNARQIRTWTLPANEGKAEAVRQGIRLAVETGAETVGYCDADLSTPADELLRLLRSMDEGPTAVLLGSRVRLLGSQIDRTASRHYFGRVFATFASIALALPVYDTQCGAKLFRVTDALRAAVAERFRSRWIFDVELIARLMSPDGDALPLRREDFREVPLLAWRDVPGSKLKLPAMMRAGWQLLTLLARYRLARRASRNARSADVALLLDAPVTEQARSEGAIRSAASSGRR